MRSELLRAELLRIARDLAPAGLVDLLRDWYRAAGALGERGIAIVEHESAALVAALHFPPDTASSLVWELHHGDRVLRASRPDVDDGGTYDRWRVLCDAHLIIETRIAAFLLAPGPTSTPCATRCAPSSTPARRPP